MRDSRAVIHNLDDHTTSSVHQAVELYFCVLSPFHRLEGIQHQVDQDLFSEFRVCGEFKSFWINADFQADGILIDIGLHELPDPIKKLFYREDLKVGLGNQSQISVGVYEMEKSLASFLDGLQCLLDIVERFIFKLFLYHLLSISVLNQSADRRSQGGYRCDRIHDLVSENPNEFLPGLHLFLFQFALDVLYGNQGKFLSPQFELGGVQSQVQ